jgi:hypothetical protein
MLVLQLAPDDMPLPLLGYDVRHEAALVSAASGIAGAGKPEMSS